MSFQGKWINFNFFSVHLFWTLGGNSIDSGKNFLALLSKLHSTCPEVQFWEVFWDKIERFLFWCNFLGKKFPEGLSKLFSWLDRNILGCIFLPLATKTFLSFSDFELKLLGLLPIKFFASVVKTALCLLSTASWGMIMLLEGNCSYAFHVLRTLTKNFWVFGETIWTCTSNPNSSCPKQSFYQTQIFWENQVFWQFQEFNWWVLDFGMKSLAENFQQGFLDCNRCLYGNVLRFCCKFCFFIFGFWSDVPLDFWRNFHRWFVKTAFFMVWEFFWGDRLRNY